MTGRAPWDTDDYSEITVFHRGLRGRHSCITRADAVALQEQGYGMMDIGAMFGLTRERIRQLFRTWEIRRSFNGTLSRVWDDTLLRFRPITDRERTEQKAQDLARYRIRRRINRLRDNRDRREQHSTALRMLAAELGRTPSTREISTKLNISLPAVLFPWTGGYNRSTGRQKRTSYRNATLDLYRRAGMTPRSAGSSGHIQ